LYLSLGGLWHLKPKSARSTMAVPATSAEAAIVPLALEAAFAAAAEEVVPVSPAEGLAPEPVVPVAPVVPAAPEAPVWKRFSPSHVDATKCMGRVWAGGQGGQCGRSRQESELFCPFHLKNDGWRKHGRLDGPIPESKLQEFLKESRKTPTSTSTPSKKRERESEPTSTPEDAQKIKPRLKHKRKLTPPLLTPDGQTLKKVCFGAYGVFWAENRESIKAALPADHKMTDIAKKAGELYKALSEEEKKILQEKFDVQNDAYHEAAAIARASAPPALPPTVQDPPATSQKRVVQEPPMKVQRSKRKRCW